MKYIITKGNKLSIYSTKAKDAIESATCVLLTNEWGIGVPAAGRESEWHIDWSMCMEAGDIESAGELVTGYAGSSLNGVILPQENSRVNCHAT